MDSSESRIIDVSLEDEEFEFKHEEHLHEGHQPPEAHLIQYAKNLIALFSSLPPNSPFRVSILKNVTVGVHVAHAALDFNTSTSSIYRAYNNEKDISQELLRYPISKRKINQQELHVARAREFFDKVIPVLSGRKYRVKRCTNENLYALYFIHCLDRGHKPLSKNYLIYNLLKKELVHHSTDDTYCPQCYQLSELRKMGVLNEKETLKLSKLENHLIKAQKQSAYMKQLKSKLSNGQLGSDTCICVHDFTQIPSPRHFLPRSDCVFLFLSNFWLV